MHPDRKDYLDYIERCSKQPTFIECVSMAVLYECDRAVRQALKGIRDPIDGRLYDTVFPWVVRDAIAAWEKEHVCKLQEIRHLNASSA